jgi:oligo-1,6-glucosidase
MDGMTQWWKNAVVYQIYPRSFADSNGDGVGDLAGVARHVDYLVDLGVDAVWLSPIYASPQDDNGYDISDYDAIDPMFGTMGDFDAMVATLHGRGIKVVMDMVLNHTSDEHAWFQASRDPGSDKRDWYIWRPPRPGHTPGAPGAEPTNWGSFFGGPGWEFDPASGEYYLHLFSRKQPDLNWENPDVRAELIAMMRRWVARGVDGFRFDVLNLISKTYPLADGPETPGTGLSMDPSVVLEGPRLAEFIQELNREVGFDEHDLLTVGEFVMVTPEAAWEHTADSHRELGMVFSFDHMMVDQVPGGMKWDLAPMRLPVLKKVLATWQDALASSGWNTLFWENHDQPRSVSRFGDDSPELRVASAKTLGTTLMFLRGTPFLYQGEELGMTNAGFTVRDQYRDIETLNFLALAEAAGMPHENALAAVAAKGRDNARTPMQWDASDTAGFPSGTPWLAVTGNQASINAADEVADPSSVFQHYRRLIEVRRRASVVRTGHFELLLPEHEAVFAYTRANGVHAMLVVANWSSETVTVAPWDLPGITSARALVTTHGEAQLTSEGLVLRPWESLAFCLGDDWQE